MTLYFEVWISYRTYKKDVITLRVMTVIYLRGIMIFCLSQAVELGSTMNEGMKKVSTRVTFVLFCLFVSLILIHSWLKITTYGSYIKVFTTLKTVNKLLERFELPLDNGKWTSYKTCSDINLKKFKFVFVSLSQEKLLFFYSITCFRIFSFLTYLCNGSTSYCRCQKIRK